MNFVFFLMMQEPVAGWTNTLVTFTLDLPNGTSQGCRMTLSHLLKNEWETLSLFEFIATGDVGEIFFSMMEIKKSYWKKGLTIQNVVTRPVYN